MRFWTTKIRAIDPIDGELKTWCGPNIEAISWQDAENYCENNLGYCQVDGELISEIPTKEDGLTPDWSKATDYEQQRLN